MVLLRLELANKWIRAKMSRGQSGISLLETLIAVGILGFIGAAFMLALSTTSKGTDAYEKRVTAASLASSQIEIVKQALYDDTPPYYDGLSPTVSLPPGYAISVETVPVETNKQQVTVKVSQGGSFVLKMTTIKAKWQL